MSDAFEGFVTYVLPLVIVFVALGLFVFLQARLKKRRMLGFAPILSDAEVTGIVDIRIRGRFCGRSAMLWTYAGNRARRNVFHFSLACDSVSPFRMRLRGWASTIMKASFPEKNFEVGVPALDTRCAFSSSDRERFTNWILGSAKACGAIQLLLDLGVNRLSLGDGSLHAEIEGFSEEQASVEFAHTVLDMLEQLARSAESA
jgi:hypothetical protein